MYPMLVVLVCLTVLMTRMELEQVSETAEEQKPMTAERARRMGRSSYLRGAEVGTQCGWW